jgi:hypothetical protein
MAHSYSLLIHERGQEEEEEEEDEEYTSNYSNDRIETFPSNQLHISESSSIDESDPPLTPVISKTA